MNLITRIVVIGCTGLFLGTTMAATVDWAAPRKATVAAVVAIVVWILLGRVATHQRGRRPTEIPADENTAR